MSVTTIPDEDGCALLRRVAASPDLPLVAAASLAVAGSVEAVLHAGQPAPNVLPDLVLAVCATAPLAFVRRWLLPSAVSVTAAVLLALVLGRRPVIAGLLALTVVFYLVGRRLPTGAALLFASPLVAYALGPAPSEAGGKALGIALVTVGSGALAAGGVRRARVEAAHRTVAVGVYADTMHAYAERAERARIARELHDIVAHHISSISVQAETARLTVPGLPDEGATRLLAIGETARRSLTEMRRLLGVLREDAGPEVTDLPQPGLRELITLVDEARDTTGGTVRLVVRGAPRRLDPGLELTAYRIIQEALTNARRHAPGAPVDVEVGYACEALRLSIRDGGAGRPCPAGGTSLGGPASLAGGASPARHGLLGMRERVAMAGGVLHAGPGRVGGFVVEAILPLSRSTR